MNKNVFAILKSMDVCPLVENFEAYKFNETQKTKKIKYSISLFGFNCFVFAISVFLTQPYWSRVNETYRFQEEYKIRSEFL